MIDLDVLFSIDETALTQAFARQASLYARYGVLLAEAEQQLAHAERVSDVEYAATEQAWRTQYAQDGQKLTEAGVKSLIITDPMYIETQEAVEAAKRTHTILKMIVRGMEQRADMLVSMGAHVRSEMGMVGMHINEPVMSAASITELKQVMKDRKQVL